LERGEGRTNGMVEEIKGYTPKRTQGERKSKKKQGETGEKCIEEGD